MKMFFLAIVMLGLTACGGGGGSTQGSYYYSGWDSTYDDSCDYGGPGCEYYYDDGSYDSGYYDSEDSSGGYYDEYGQWVDPTYTYSRKNPSEGRNVVGDVAALTLKVVKSAGQKLAAKYGLSSETGYNIARLYNTWAVIGKDRSRTEKDVKDFTRRLYGIDANKIKISLEAAQKGEMSLLEENLEEVADNWGTTPEMVKAMQKEWFAPQLKNYGY